MERRGNVNGNTGVLKGDHEALNWEGDEEALMCVEERCWEMGVFKGDEKVLNCHRELLTVDGEA